jgi:hypothetical protein
MLSGIIDDASYLSLRLPEHGEHLIHLNLGVLLLLLRLLRRLLMLEEVRHRRLLRERHRVVRRRGELLREAASVVLLLRCLTRCIVCAEAPFRSRSGGGSRTPRRRSGGLFYASPSFARESKYASKQ